MRVVVGKLHDTHSSQALRVKADVKNDDAWTFDYVQHIVVVELVIVWFFHIEHLVSHAGEHHVLDYEQAQAI